MREICVLCALQCLHQLRPFGSYNVYSNKKCVKNIPVLPSLAGIVKAL